MSESRAQMQGERDRDQNAIPSAEAGREAVPAGAEDSGALRGMAGGQPIPGGLVGHRLGSSTWA